MLCTEFIARVAHFIYRIALSVTFAVASGSHPFAHASPPQQKTCNRRTALGSLAIDDVRSVQLQDLWDDLKRNLDPAWSVVGRPHALDMLVKKDDLRTAAERFIKAWQCRNGKLGSSRTIRQT